jgi:hypothetical protein
MIEKLIITKTLRDTYKKRSSMAHAVLADRIQERTGNKIASNTRMGYVYFLNTDRIPLDVTVKGKIKETKKKGQLQGDRIEDPDYMIEHGIKPDPLFYITNQIMKPSCQFLEHAIEDPESIFNFYITKEILRRKGKKGILSFDIYKDDDKTCSFKKETNSLKKLIKANNIEYAKSDRESNKEEDSSYDERDDNGSDE